MDRSKTDNMADVARLRAVIDEMTLDVADVKESTFTKELARRALAYTTRLRTEQRS